MQKLISGGYVSDDDAAIVRYGLELNIMKAAAFSAMFIVAAVLKSAVTALVFIAFFSVLRSCCGGYHAKTRIFCLISSTLIMAAVIAAVRLTPEGAVLPAAMVILSVGVLLIAVFAPVDTPAKPFDDIERRVFRRRSLTAAAGAAAITAVSAFFGLYMLTFSAAMAVFSTGLLLVIGRLSNRKGATK